MWSKKVLSTFSTVWSQGTMCSLAGGENKSLISTLLTAAPLNFVFNTQKHTRDISNRHCESFFIYSHRLCACLNKTSRELGKLL